MESALTSKGQTTIPKAVREYLHLTPGDRVKFFFHPDGSVVLLPKIPITALKGLLQRPSEKPSCVEQKDDAIGNAVSERDRNSRQR